MSDQDKNPYQPPSALDHDVYERPKPAFSSSSDIPEIGEGDAPSLGRIIWGCIKLLVIATFFITIIVARLLPLIYGRR